MTGYSLTTKSGKRATQPPLWSGSLRDEDGTVYLSFSDLQEVRFVDAYYNTGVPWKIIRAAATNASIEYQSSHPFSTKKFKTDGYMIFGDVVSASGVPPALLELSKKQFHIRAITEPGLYEGLEFSENDNVLRWWPMGDKRRVVLDPARSFGQPTDSKRFVQTSVLAASYRAEKSFERVAWWFGTDSRSVRDAVEYEEKLAA